MTLRFEIAPLAQDDILDHAFYLSDQNAEVSVRFFTNVYLSIQRLSEMPELGSLYGFTGASNVRIWPVKGFHNHLIFYRIQSDRIQILRVLHGSTDCETLFKS